MHRSGQSGRSKCSCRRTSNLSGYIHNVTCWRAVQQSAATQRRCHPAACTASSSTRPLSRRIALVTAVAGLGTSALIAAGLLGAGTATAAAIGTFDGSSSTQDPRALTRTGMQKFRENDVEGSVADFDEAVRLDPRLHPFMWQRGLSLYYLGQFQEGAQQFRDDVAVNPNDTEEAIWAFLCEAQIDGPLKARQNMLKVGRDPRPVMRVAYETFCSAEQPPEAILEAAAKDPHDAFYALLYFGLWHEAHGDAGAAHDAILAAVATQYARYSGDYMASVATVHCLRRGWMDEQRESDAPMPA